MGTGHITFYRERPRQDFLRSYRILVDGEEIGTLDHDDSLSVDLPEGPHTAQARISWTGSSEQSFDVLADVETRVCVCPSLRDGFVFGDLRRSMSRAGWLRLVPDEMSSGHGKLAEPNPDSPLSEPRASSRALRWSIVFLLINAAFIAFAVFAFARAPKWTGLVIVVVFLCAIWLRKWVLIRADNRKQARRRR
jgi:hypothetical protein